MIWILLSLACKPEVDTPTEKSCEDNTINYHTVGQPFLRTYCTSCHSAQLDGAARFGAPANVNLDTLRDARNFAARIRARSLDSNTMPPTGGIQPYEKELIAQWLDCGTPGDEVEPLAVETTPDSIDAHNVLAMAIRDHSNPEIIQVTREVNSGGTDDERLGLWSLEWYRITPDEAWFLGYDIYETPSRIGRSVRFDPELPILLREPEWNVSVMATIETDQGVEVEQQEWYGTAHFLGPDDGHERDGDPLDVVVTREGESWRWHMSSWYAVTAQWVDLPDGSGWESLQYMGGNATPAPEMFSLHDNAMWAEKMIAWGGE